MILAGVVAPGALGIVMLGLAVLCAHETTVSRHHCYYCGGRWHFLGICSGRP